MLACAHIFVHMYSRLADGEHVVAMTLHPSGDCAEVQIFNRVGESASCVLTEGNMSTLKSGCHESISWQNFFDLLQKAFADHTIEFSPPQLKITVKHERHTDAVPIVPFSTSLVIPLPKLSSRGGAIYDLAASMVSYAALRSGDKKELERLESIGKLEAAMTDEVIQVRQEIAVLEAESSTLIAQRAHAEALAKETVALAGQDAPHLINELAERAVLDPHKIDKVVSRVTDPLHGKPRRSYSMDVLTVFKGFTALDNGGGGLSQGRPFDVIPAVSKEQLDTLANTLLMDPIASQMVRAYQLVEEWDFDIFRFDALCKQVSGGPFPAGALFYMGYIVICRLGLMAKFNLSEACLLSWLSMLEAGYDNWPFHNAMHAADTLQACFYFLTTAEGNRRLGLTDSDQLALVLAAAMHDFAHPGTDNSFQVRARTPVACIYADESPLEQMHFAAAMELMKLQRYNLLRMVEPSLRECIEDTMGNLILATDLERHDTVVAAFRLKLHEWGNINPNTVGEGVGRGDDALVVLCMLIKAADVSCYARRDDLYTQWAVRQQQENQRQGQLEAAAGLSVSPFMGSHIMFHTTMAKLQIGFINACVIPTMSELVEVLPKIRLCGEHVAKNRNKWANAEENEALGRV